nr:sister chromatid cohesion protein DCC1-like isoform X2 [Procambarus clarkii]
MACIGRTLEDVKKLIHHAKLTEDELLPVTQMLEFTEDFGLDSSETVLMEVDQTLLETIKKDDKFVLRGDPDDGAVLCTKDKTYEVRLAETSNSMVLVPELSLPEEEEAGERVLHSRQVCGIHYTYLELRQCKPRIHKLRTLLGEAPFSGVQSHAQECEGQRYTLSDLLDRVQCSEEELDKALQELEAYHLYGFWQTLEFDYQFKVVSHILNLIDSKSWPLDGVPRYETFKELSELEPRTVITQCFDYYLKPTGKERDDGLTTNVSQLEGIALVDRSLSADTISYFPVTSLPQGIQERFNCLFETREKWTLDEIRPYVEDLAGGKTPVSALLTKYARASTLDGLKYYSGKHAR